MEEPSVLDYLKSKLKFWEKGNKIEIPDEEEPRMPEEPVLASAPVEKVPEENTPPRHERPPFDWKNFPWRSLLALLFILLAQRTFEPSPNRAAAPGLILYAIGLTWLTLAYLRGEWKLADVAETGSGSDPLGVRLLPLGLAGVFGRRIRILPQQHLHRPQCRPLAGRSGLFRLGLLDKRSGPGSLGATAMALLDPGGMATPHYPLDSPSAGRDRAGAFLPPVRPRRCPFRAI